MRGLETRGPHAEFRNYPERFFSIMSVSRKFPFLCVLKTVQIGSFSPFLSEMVETLLESWISFFKSSSRAFHFLTIFLN